MTWWHDDINDQQRVNAIASRNATKFRSKQPRDINWDSAIKKFRSAITAYQEPAASMASAHTICPSKPSDCAMAP